MVLLTLLLGQEQRMENIFLNLDIDWNTTGLIL